MSDTAPPTDIASVSGRPATPEPEPNALPPVYTPPTSFTIGALTTNEPLLGIPEIKGHLALLHAFAELKIQLEAAAVVVPNVPEDKERKWGWFVGLAVERFDVWRRSIKPGDVSNDMKVILPPVDVLMVWHAYMLNPRRYAEDCMRIVNCKSMKQLEPHFTRLLEQGPSSPIFTVPASRERVNFWGSRTGLSFDPFEGINTMTKRIILCPKCNAPVQVDFMNELGTGYLQQKFTATCSKGDCELGEITRERLALRKLAEDLAVIPSADFVSPESYLAGSFFTAFASDASKANAIKESIRDGLKGSYATGCIYGSKQRQEMLCQAIMKRSEYSLSVLKAQMGIETQPRLVGNIMNAYNDDKIYSVDLLGAVVRQSSFVGKMYDLGWTRPGYFDGQDDEMPLQHALARYHSFLDLMSSSPASFFVPTLDIDLVWRTHQLMPTKYNNDCETYMKRFIDHDDTVDGPRLSSAFDLTCRAWKERFHVEYTPCGSRIPGDAIGQRPSPVVGIHASPTNPAAHLTPFEGPNLLSATPPSNHMAGRLVSQQEAERVQKLIAQRNESLARAKQNQKDTERARQAALEWQRYESQGNKRQRYRFF